MPATLDRTAPTSSRVTGWDFAAIGLLAIAGFALSYDALRQMAIAIHVRSLLTYVFPLIIDGFIAYSVRALLILRTAPLTARAYVWLLFGASTTASIWANVLHAVRLNQQTLAVTGYLHLSDLSVGILSAVAPLALAGSVHLGIITARHTNPTATRTADPSLTEDAFRAVSGTEAGPRFAERGIVPASRRQASHAKAKVGKRRRNSPRPAPGPKRRKTFRGPFRAAPSTPGPGTLSSVNPQARGRAEIRLSPQLPSPPAVRRALRSTNWPPSACRRGPTLGS
ncbi:DUF2637 domain-containing protein [Kitasatospora sp. NPDC101235]|uniref:DUF2637 domain-containing protein n=1 Tax=Kitasatospora sp. NPDC101235 TaxID=3364101 RepID=UPI0037F89A24